jgi:multidrug efflux pump subunit AcrA (membrane-fusion protein)
MSNVAVLSTPAAIARCTWAVAAALAVVWSAPPPQARAAERKDLGVVMAVSVVPAKNMCFADTLQVTGVLTPRREVLVRPEREGLQISQVLVEPGETVSSGQALVRLNPPDGQQGSTTTVTAPVAGRISAASAVVGATASSRGEPLFRIAERGEMELQAETPVKTLSRLAVDQTAKIEIVGVGELNGKVRHVSTAINPMTQLGQVRIFVGNDSRLRVGAFGRAIVNIGRRCGPSVPLSAVLYGPSGSVVQVVRDGRVETRRVNVGLIASGQVEIREGLANGDSVVARAGAFVRDGDRVRPVTTAEASRT